MEIAKELDQRKYRILFSTYSDAVEFVSREGFSVVKSPEFRYWTWPDGTVDPWRSFKWTGIKTFLTFWWQVKTEVNHLQNYRPDLVISDSRLSTLIAAKMLGIPVLTILNQLYVMASGFIHHRGWRDFARAFSLSFVATPWGLSDEVLIPDFPPPYTISKFNIEIQSKYTHKIRYVGPILPTRPENLPDSDEIKRKFGFDQRPLIYAAVSGPKSEREWLGEKLLKYLRNLPPKYQLVISLANKAGSSSPQRDGNVTVFEWLPSRFEMLKACDVIIGRGSHSTVTQSLAFGKPMVLIPTQEQTEQISNTRAAVALGVAEALDQRRLSSEALLSSLEHIFLSKTYWTNAEKIARLSKEYNGLQTILQKVEEHCAARRHSY